MRKLTQRLNLVLNIKCDEASRLTSESFERPLLFHERLAVRCHQLVCWSCRQFEKQLTLIREAFEQAAREEAIDLDQGNLSRDRLVR